MQKSNLWLATALLNERVRNRAGENLGKIEDIAIDPETGNIQYAILSFGGVLGMGDKLFPIPWSSLSASPSRDYTLLDVDQENLKHAPTFDREAWPHMGDPIWSRSKDYYRRETPIVAEHRVVVERPARTKPGMSVLAAILLVALILGLAWMTFLVSTRGWDQARQDMKSSLQSA